MCVRLPLVAASGVLSFDQGSTAAGTHTSEHDKSTFSSPFSLDNIQSLAVRLASFTDDTSWSSSVIADALQNDQREVWAELDQHSPVDGYPVGFYPVGFYIVHVGPFDLEIEMIAVAFTHRRRGIAGKLLRHAQARVQALGKESLLLEVRRSNNAAHQLYLSEGMQQEGIRKGYYPPSRGAEHERGREDALLFSWVPSLKTV